MNQSGEVHDFFFFPLDWRRFKYVIFTLFGLVFFGLCGNVTVLVVWSVDRVFRPTRFLIRCLAVCDIFLLLSNIFYILFFINKQHYSRVVAWYAALWFRVLNVHTTLVLVASRWVAVYRPLAVNAILTRKRVIRTYFALMAWSATAVVVHLACYLIMKPRPFLYVFAVIQLVYLFLPVLILILLNIHLVYILKTGDRGEGSQPNQPFSCTLQPRLFAAVLVISIFTVVAYPAGALSRVAVSLHTGIGPEIEFTISAISRLLEMFNSAINVVFYYIFVGHFRHQVRHLLSLLCSCNWAKES
ncbi:hypothetical protein ACOMHN_013072 [Nucella lapillus]